MSRLVRVGILVVLALAFPTEALARRAQTEAELVAPGDVGPAPGTHAGAGVARLRVAPDPGLQPPEFRVALQRTSPALEQCLTDAGLTGTMRVTATVALSHALGLTIVAPRHDAGATQCAELVLRRALTGIAARALTQPLRASLTVRHRAARPPRVPAPAHPATGELAAFEGPVHAAIEHDRSALIQCLSGAAPGVVGDASLRVTLAPDGTLTLASVNMPTGVPAGPALPCLASRIAQLRFSPAPPRSVAIEHSLPLGL